MIYFVQDDRSHYIKIGYTAHEDVEGRLGAIRTATPGNISVLLTLPGSRQDESDLHERFADHREVGEWFKPGPELLKFIVAEAGMIGAKKCPSFPQSGGVGKKPWPLKIYLAGKMTRRSANHDSCWRDSIINDVGETIAIGPPDKYDSLPALGRAIGGVHDYLGPYYFDIGFGHSSFRPGDHGLDVSGLQHDCDNRGRIFKLCLDAVSRADVIFAWINSTDCFGTHFEVAYAHALGKQIWLGFSDLVLRDQWFLFQAADHFGHSPSCDAAEAFAGCLSSYEASLSIRL